MTLCGISNCTPAYCFTVRSTGCEFVLKQQAVFPRKAIKMCFILIQANEIMMGLWGRLRIQLVTHKWLIPETILVVVVVIMHTFNGAAVL